jgi:hypothetical protein
MAFMFQSPQQTPARLEAQRLAEEWRAADGAVRLLSTRRRLQQRTHSVNFNGVSLAVLADSAGVPVPTPQLVDSAGRAAWRQLGLGETKVRVVLIAQFATVARLRERPAGDAGYVTYLAPDSTDRTTCLAVVPMGPYWTREFFGERAGRVPFGELVQTIDGGLGPCAFYAAYGTPGQSVRSWLVARGWDVALTLDPGPRRRPGNSLVATADPRYAWFWDVIYTLPPSAVGCLASRPAACRAAVVSGASADPVIQVPDIMRVDRRWYRTVRLAEGRRFLADVAHEVGRERFLDFWTSAQPVDTALALALKRPVGDWTAAWQREFVRPIRLGPTPPLGALALAIALGALAVALVCVRASRRQVR